MTKRVTKPYTARQFDKLLRGADVTDKMRHALRLYLMERFSVAEAARDAGVRAPSIYQRLRALKVDIAAITTPKPPRGYTGKRPVPGREQTTPGSDVT